MNKFFLILALIISTPVMIFSQEKTDDQIRYKKHTVLDFSDVLIEGELKRPSGFLVLKRAHVRFQGLIKLRENFDKEIIESIDIISNWE